MVPAAAASGDLDELGADDILESDDIEPIEAAAAGFKGFEGFEAPPSDPNGFEIAEIDTFEEIVVEGLEAAKVDAVELAPASINVEYTAPSPSTLVGMPSVIAAAAVPAAAIPPGPTTSPIALESTIVDDALPEKTLELCSNDVSKVAAAAAALDASEPQQTEVLKRSDMPATAFAAQPGAAVHAGHAARPFRKAMSGLAIGGIVFAAVAFVGLVGVGGFVASRALSDKAEPVASAATTTTTTGATTEGNPSAAAAAAPTAVEPATAAAATEPASPATLDVSELPSAPVPAAAPRGFTGSASFAPSAVAIAPSAPAPRGKGGSPLAAPGQGSTSSGGVKTTVLPPPGAAPASRAAAGATPLPPPSPPIAVAAPAAAQSSTGIVRVDPNLRAVVVDGAYRRATDGVLTVSCGSHRIKAGMKDQQTVNVPCGGSVSL